MDDCISVKGSKNDKLYEQNNKRNYSLDVLRILSIFMIVLLHIESHGGVDSFYDSWTFNGFFLKFLNTLCYVSVNVFVLISGYHLIYSRFKLSKLLKICIECFFYSCLVFVYLVAKGKPLSVVDYLTIFLPISYNSYWFVTAYVGLYLLSPFLNIVISFLNKKTHLALLILLLLLYSLLRDVLIKSEPFSVGQGYSLVWFVVLYFSASYIRKYVDLHKVRIPLAKYFLFVLIPFVIWLLLLLLSNGISFISTYNLPDYWIRYNSIFIFLASVFLFIFFARKNLKENAFIRLISFVSSLSLGVYLIHDNRYFRDFLWQDIFRTNSLSNTASLIPFVLLIAVSVFVLCTLIDLVRKILFDLVYKRKWFVKIMALVDALPYRIAEIMCNISKRESN